MQNISRQKFLQTTAMAGAAMMLSSLESLAAQTPDQRLKIGIIGCGSVSNRYIPHLKTSPLLEIVSLCDIKYDRALAQVKQYELTAKTYPDIDAMLKGVPFDMMITITDMQVHGQLNRKALMAGRHVWSEKPMANTYAEGKALLDLAKSKNLRIWGAPAVVNSPQFAFMSRCIQEGKLGRIASAHGQYGHTGPTWSAFFYEKGGGSMPDLGVYNMATLTGLLGPAKSIMAMTSIVNPQRTVDDKGEIKVEAEDNAHILMEHANNALSHVMCGFNYFDPHGHEAKGQTLHSIQVYGDLGNMRLIGYDWEPMGVVLDNSWTEPAKLYQEDAEGYQWQEGATKIGESLVKQIEPRIAVDHALHVLEIIEAARASSATGKKISLQSTFKWPMLILTWLFLGLLHGPKAWSQQHTWCNPINIDYGYTPIPNFSEWGRHRATADPVIVNYKGDYYLFSTNQWGYWWSSDLLDWKFIPRKFLRPWNQGYDELCAPAIGIIGDTMIVFGSTYNRNFTIWMSTDPKSDQWRPLVDSFDIGGWDPAFFTDDDGKLYMYNGSSNAYPLYGIELNRKTFQPIGTRKETTLLHPDRFGWQRFGEYYDNTFLDPFIEGSWMTKHNGKYYLQYGAPGTEFSGYADGVVVGDGPLGPFDQPQSDPFSFHPGGFARGAGHGSTFMDNDHRYWHISTITIAVKNSFERRLGLWPAGFDKEGVMYMNAAFGDYPHHLPSGEFTGWMLLNYKKPVLVSSTLAAGHPANDAVDEDIKTYWSAATGNKGEWIQTDLGSPSTVHAVQINYADQDAEFLGKQSNIYHQYKLYHSTDGKKWTLLIDKSGNQTDIPHEYVELRTPVTTRYIRLENIHMPTGKFAISGLRVFGKGAGAPPDTVKQLIVLRTEKDKRSAWIKWSPVDNAYAYNIYTGTAPDKLYNCIMVHDANEYYDKLMDKDKAYYFSIEAVNENGVSARTHVISVD